MHSFLSTKMTGITTWFYTGFRKFLVLERKKLDMGVWTQLEMSLMGSNTLLRTFYLSPLNEAVLCFCIFSQSDLG